MTPSPLRALLAEATKPWVLVDWEPCLVLIGYSYKGTDSEADARLIALAPEMALLLADMGDALSCQANTNTACAGLHPKPGERQCRNCALLARLSALGTADR